MKYPAYIDKVANGYILTPTPLHGEFTPAENEIFVFENLDTLFEHLKKQEQQNTTESAAIPNEEDNDRVETPLNDVFEDIATT